MADARFDRVIELLRQFEDSVLAVTPNSVGGSYRCPVAPSLASLNFVRVDPGQAPDLSTAVQEARAAAHKLAVRTIVLDEYFGPNTNLAFGALDGNHEWTRDHRLIYVWDSAKAPKPSEACTKLTLDDFVAARHAFFAAEGGYAQSAIVETETSTRAIAGAWPTEQWGVVVDGHVVSAGELYFFEGAAQLESLSTLPSNQRQGLAALLTEVRVARASDRGKSLIFAQIEWHNAASIALHKKLGFTHVGSREVFSF